MSYSNGKVLRLIGMFREMIASKNKWKNLAKCFVEWIVNCLNVALCIGGDTFPNNNWSKY